MDLVSLKKEQLKNHLFNLMDDVAYCLSNESDIDKFLDQTELFNEWEKMSLTESPSFSFIHHLE